ncbi:hypothetical protein Dimus_024881, partial [Dionaea muscipula]
LKNPRAAAWGRKQPLERRTTEGQICTGGGRATTASAPCEPRLTAAERAATAPTTRSTWATSIGQQRHQLRQREEAQRYRHPMSLDQRGDTGNNQQQQRATATSEPDASPARRRPPSS